MHYIGKTFQYHGAHRIFNQDLSKYEGTILQIPSDKRHEQCKCLHGHTVKIVAVFGSNELQDDMVIDFTYLKAFKDMIDRWFDHTFLIYKNDPLCSFFSRHISELPVEVASGITVTSFNPTAENLASFFHHYLNYNLSEVQGKDNARIWCDSVKVYETETSYAECTISDDLEEYYNQKYEIKTLRDFVGGK